MAPTVGDIAGIIEDHAEMMAEHQSEHYAILAIRKHIGWYLTGYPVGGAARKRLVESASLNELRSRLAELDPTVTLPPHEYDRPRGNTRGPHNITLPSGWISADADAPPEHDDADLVLSGG